jgi:hypothetical protein
MVRARKKSQGISLYPQDWDRARRNLKEDERLIEYIQEALLIQAEIREGKRKIPPSMVSLGLG